MKRKLCVILACFLLSTGIMQVQADTLSDLKQKQEELEKQEKERIENKIVAQKNDPLYDDIHQIAGDLRFIKNLIIIGLVCGFILGLIGIFGML